MALSQFNVMQKSRMESLFCRVVMTDQVIICKFGKLSLFWFLFDGFFALEEVPSGSWFVFNKFFCRNYIAVVDIFK